MAHTVGAIRSYIGPMTLPRQGAAPDGAATTTPTPDGASSPTPSPQQRPSVRAALTPVAVTLGLLSIAAVGTGFIARFHAGETEHGRILMGRLEFGLWSVLIGVSLAIWAAVGTVTGWALYTRWKPRATRPQGRVLAVYVAGAVAFNVVIFSAMVVLNNSSRDPDGGTFPLDGVVWRMSALVVLAQLASLPSVLGVWDVQTRLTDLAARFPPPGTAGDTPQGALQLLDQLWKDSMRHLTCVSLVISTAVIDTGALRNALLSYGRQASVQIDFPASHVLVYGAFFSLIFALVFIPVALQWRALAHRLVETAQRVPEATGLTSEWLEQRAALTTFLRLDLSLPKLLAPPWGSSPRWQRAR